MTKNKILLILSEFRKFLRIEVNMVMVFMALSGYIMFNKPGLDAFFLATAMFFVSGAGYAYNHYTDKEEDLINNKKLNYFVSTKTGYYIIAICAFLSIVSATYLSQLSFIMFVIAFVASFIYSVFRIKRVFPMKNIYSGFFMSISFLIGATAKNIFTFQMIPYFLLVFLIGLTGNLLGDIRGYEGDKEVGVRTIPVAIGISKAKKIVHFNFGIFSFASLIGYYMLTPIIPSLIATSFFLNKNDHKRARMSMISTFFVLVPVLTAIKFLDI